MNKKIEQEKLTIYEVEEFHKELVLLYDKAEDSLTLDFKSVEKVDMTAIQLLLSAQKSFEKKSLEMFLRNVSPEIVETFAVAGCETLLKVQND